MSQQKLQKFYDTIHVTPHPDGTFTRSSKSVPSVPPSTTDPNSHTLSKDVLLDSEKNTFVRIFLPRDSLNHGQLPGAKLPVLVFVHGGGFVFGSPDYPPFHEFCSVAARELHALVISVGYRLAPEHRLPAAYEDVWEALTWVKDSRDEWLGGYADLSNCVLMGESAGANVVYNVGLKMSAQIDDFKPLVIKGLVLVQPFFGGLDRTGSETRLAHHPVVSLDTCDVIWEVCLPSGEDRGHEYCDPCRDDKGSDLVDRVRELGWWVVVVGCEGDPFSDRGVELAKLLEKRGVVSVRSLFSQGGQHGMFVSFCDFDKRKEFLDFVKEVWP
ncbi:hypothetical protein vseg_001216 [Gypsophila vaccaria]